jgi:hypothetical protein
MRFRPTGPHSVGARDFAYCPTGPDGALSPGQVRAAVNQRSETRVTLRLVCSMLGGNPSSSHVSFDESTNAYLAKRQQVMRFDYSYTHAALGWPDFLPCWR